MRPMVAGFMGVERAERTKNYLTTEIFGIEDEGAFSSRTCR